MREPFIEKDKTRKPGFNVAVLLNNKEQVKGSVGIEIELEGHNFVYHEEVPSPWVYKEDGSLRGEESAEYVLKKPIEFKDVNKALTTLFEALEKKKAKFDDSNRTSIHVHLNCQQFHLNRLAALMSLWFTFEDPLTQWCGEHRVGNLFCLRGRDASAIISHLRKFIKSDGKYQLGDHLHYSGLNAQALKKFGSLEIRTMRGVSDPTVIQDWVEILQRLYEYSATVTDPRNVCSMFSGYGPMSMFNTVFGPKAQTIRAGISWTDMELTTSLYEGIRRAQDICYCRDWDLYNPQTIKEDPFNRDLKKVMKKLSHADWNLETNSIEPGQIYHVAPGTHIFSSPVSLQSVADSISSQDPYSW
jgi:hypothetical protein